MLLHLAVRALMNHLFPLFLQPFWHCSPPSFTYNAHNWDTLSHPNLGMMGRAMRIVNEVVLSPVMPYHTKRSIFAEGEHEALHSKLADSLTDYPHTFWWGPVYKKPRDPSSGMVAIIGGAGSWDVRPTICVSVSFIFLSGILLIPSLLHHAIFRSPFASSFPTG